MMHVQGRAGLPVTLVLGMGVSVAALRHALPVQAADALQAREFRLVQVGASDLGFPDPALALQACRGCRGPPQASMLRHGAYRPACMISRAAWHGACKKKKRQYRVHMCSLVQYIAPRPQQPQANIVLEAQGSLFLRP